MHVAGLEEVFMRLGQVSHSLCMGGSRRTSYAGKPLSSRYRGVTRVDARYQAYVIVDGRRVYGGTWATERQAAVARDRMALGLGLGRALNFPRVASRHGPATAKELRDDARARARKKRKPTARYIGVSWQQRYQKWAARVGRRTYVGRFDDAKTAALARDRVALALYGARAALNFPDRPLKPATPTEMRAWSREVNTPRTSSRYRGVRWLPTASETRPWAAQLRHGGRTFCLGTWETEREAAFAYDRAVLFYLGPSADLNFPKQAAAMEPADARTLSAESYKRYKTTTTSRFRGVWRSRRDGLWHVDVRKGEIRRRLGPFCNEVEAALEYDHHARRLFGAAAKLNFQTERGRGRGGKRSTAS